MAHPDIYFQDMKNHDYYEILGVERTAEASAIKAAFRKLLSEHPDKVRGSSVKEGLEGEALSAAVEAATKKFQGIKEAYETLSDPAKRATYDRYGHAGLNAAKTAARSSHGGGAGFDAKHFEESFAEFEAGLAKMERASYWIAGASVVAAVGYGLYKYHQHHARTEADAGLKPGAKSWTKRMEEQPVPIYQQQTL